MKKFCHNCGNQSAKLDAKFCTECGVSLGSLSAKPTPPAVAAKVNPTFLPFQVAEDDDMESVDYMQHYRTNLQSLDVEIRTFETPKETFAGLVKEGEMNPAPPIAARPSPFASEKEALESYKKEAGTLRK